MNCVNLKFISRSIYVPATLEIPNGDSPFPLVVMAHGHGGDKEEGIGFAAIANALEEKGIASIRMDFPGCGQSSESFRKNNLTNMKQDVRNAVAYTKENYPVDTTKVGIFGYSMGGRVALELLGEDNGFAAAALLAPANSTVDMKTLFGGADNWEAMKIKALKNGFAVHAWNPEESRELSREWFTDLEKIADPAQLAAENFINPVIVIYATDDPMVSPSVPAAVAKTLNAEVTDATGDGHFFGFFAERTGIDRPEVLNAVVKAVAEFFVKTLT